MTSILISVLLAIHVFCCILLVLLVLVQKPRQEGLGTAFGGGITDSLLGAGAATFFAKATTWLGIIFFATTISLAYLYSHRPQESSLQEKLKSIPLAAPVSNKTSPSSSPDSPAPGSMPSPTSPTSPTGPTGQKEKKR